MATAGALVLGNPPSARTAMLLSSAHPAVPRHVSGANSVRDRANSGDSLCRVWAGFSHKSERLPSVPQSRRELGMGGPREVTVWRSKVGGWPRSSMSRVRYVQGEAALSGWKMLGGWVGKTRVFMQIPAAHTSRPGNALDKWVLTGEGLDKQDAVASNVFNR